MAQVAGRPRILVTRAIFLRWRSVCPRILTWSPICVTKTGAQTRLRSGSRVNRVR